MTRKLFTFVVAHPVDVQAHDLPRVRESYYFLEGDNLEHAFATIADFEHVADATEVFGVECSRLMITPLTLLQSEKPLSDWQHWSDLQRRGELESKWMLMAEGPESFGQRQERLFVERFPQFSATDDYGSCAKGAASVFLS